MSRRPLTRQESQAITRARLIKAGRRVFLKHGFYAASIEQVARAAGHTTGALYSNFDSKEALCLAVLEDRFAEVGTSLQEALGSAESTADARLAAIEKWWQTLPDVEHWGLLAAEFVLVTRTKPAIRKQLGERVALVRSLLAGVLESQRAELGLDLKFDAERLAVAALGLGCGLAVLRTADPTLPDDVFTPSLRLLLGR
ncbi:MAG: TetR/AcrR family transcriptional regulator [Acidimicrobiales bacterium]